MLIICHLTSAEEASTCLRLFGQEFSKLLRRGARELAQTGLMLGSLLGAVDLNLLSVRVRVRYKFQDVIVVFVTLAAQLHDFLVVSDDPRMVEHLRNLDSLLRLADQKF